MKIIKLETFTVRVPYKRVEASSLINRGGVTEVIVKLTADNGLIGWGECTRAADTAGIESAVKAMTPLVIGRDAWDKEAIHRDLGVFAVWAFQPMTGNFAFAGIDMALWDLCGKQCGQPLYRLFGGAMREEVDYFYYMEWGTPEEIARQAADGVKRGYHAYYIKAGVDEAKEEAMLEALRQGVGPTGKIRIDVNQAWTLPQAVRVLKRWHARFDIDFVEAPVRIDPVENMLDLRRQCEVSLCVNEGLWREAEAYRIIKSRCGDYLCFSPYWVGSLGRFHGLVQASHMEGWQVCKHTHGELGLAAAAGFKFDTWAEGGDAGLTHQDSFSGPTHQQGIGKLSAQFSTVKGLPDLSSSVADIPFLRDTAGPVLRWLGDSRVAVRAYGGVAVPSRGEFFTMGGSELFRGFDLAERQGSTVWVGSVEWRLPIAKGLTWDLCDHVVGLRNLYGAAFYDVGDVYVSGHEYGPIAHALGGGIRADVAWFGFVERTMLRFDVAKTINADSAVQFWLGVSHPF